MTSTPPAAPTSRWRFWLVALTLLLVAVGFSTWAVWHRNGTPLATHNAPLQKAERPRPDSPFLNTSLAVGYVGDEACASCHGDIAQTYRQHSMGNSLAPVADLLEKERIDAEANNPFEAGGFQFRVERRDDRLFHQEVLRDHDGRALVEQEAEVAYAIGSGKNGRTYLVNRDGFLYQSPISWYSAKEIWDVSPGYGRHNQHFTRPITSQCLFCHSNQVRPVEGSINRYETDPLFAGHAIGCERCHGPGELHVQRRQGGDEPGAIDHTIVNPRHLEPELREGICQQCHLHGEVTVERRSRHLHEYRPGLPWHDFLAVFLKPPEASGGFKAVTHVEQMHVSKCFTASAGKLGCISCHDPHAMPPADVAARGQYFRDRCLQCHAEESCTVPPTERVEKNQDRCTDCHMQRSSLADIAHTSATDHRILRRPEDSPQIELGDEATNQPLLPFQRLAGSAGDSDSQRDFGIALVQVARTQGPLSEDLRRRLYRRALPLLEQAVNDHSSDVPAAEALGMAWWKLGDHARAVERLNNVFEKAREREPTLFALGQIGEEAGRVDLARDFFERLRGANPHDADAHLRLSLLAAAEEDWTGVRAHTKTGLEANPFHPGFRQVLARYYLEQQRDLERARQEMEIAALLQPAAAADIRAWFRGLQRGASR